MAAEVHLRLNGNVDHLRIAWQAAEVMLEHVPFPDDPVQTRYNVLLALQEAVSNILRHGYAGRSPAAIELGMAWDGDGFVVEIRDEAPPFDPTQVGSIKSVSDGKPIPEGGYGIHIMRAVLDRMHYRREGGRNVLTLEKSLIPVLDEV